jgi:selenide, water dikinase
VADEKRALVEPECVTSFRRRRGCEARGDRHAETLELDAHHVGLGQPAGLSRTQEQRAAVAHERRIIGVERVRVARDRFAADDHLCTRAREQLTERLMLPREPCPVWLAMPAIAFPVGEVLGPRPLDENAPERRNHALAAERVAWATLHCVETTAGLDTLGTGGGCAAKYSAALLEELLAGLATAAPDDLLVGLDPPDDAAVYRLSSDQAIVLTTDFFPPMVDDPALFGAIAATNALNDVFAMGGKPLVALSIAVFPEDLALDSVRAVFDAAATKVAEAGGILAGGHTIRDREPKYGLAVVGTVHPQRVWMKSGARPGDVLLLTKPLGTGLVLTGVRERILGAQEFVKATAWMTTLSDRAADVLRPFEPSAVTDVTGFGLFGHAHEIAKRSAARLVLEGGNLPALDGAIEAAEHGLRTGGDPRNRAYVGDAVELRESIDEIAALGFDAQTAGGLLVALPAERAAVAEATFSAQGLFLARIGRVEEGAGVRVV